MTSPRLPAHGESQLPVGLDAFASVASTAAPIPTAARSTRSSSSMYGHGSPVGSTADGETDSTGTEERGRVVSIWYNLSASSSLGSGEDEVEDSSRRQVHNMCERNRRHHIREGFSSLQRKKPGGLGPELVTDSNIIL